jgi:hypothetical protein
LRYCLVGVVGLADDKACRKSPEGK